MKNLLRLTAIFAFCAFAVALQAKPAIQVSRTEAAQAAPGPAEAKTEQGKPGEALAERSNEAAGKEEKSEDQEELLKHSAMVKNFAKWTGLQDHLRAAYWIFTALNFALLLAALRKLVPFLMRYFEIPFAYQRRERVKAGLDDARKASDDANRRLSEIESKLSRLDVDIAAIRAEAEAVNKAEEARMQASIEEERRKIVLSSQQEVEAAASQARRELKIYAADLAVSLAEKKINVDEATDKALVRSFTEQINAGKDGR